MKNYLTVTCVSFATLLSAWAMPALAADRPSIGRGGRIEVSKKAEKKWNESEYVFTAKLDGVDAGPVSRSMPPIYSHTLHFTVEKVLRGPLKPGAKIKCSHSARQNQPPTFPEGKVCLVAAAKSRGRLQAKIVEPSTPEKLAEVTLACSLPLGWKIADGKPLSPWSGMSKAWNASIDAEAKSSRGRQSIFEGTDIVLVHRMSLIIASGPCLSLGLESSTLVERIVEF